MSSKQAYMRKFIILDEQRINYSNAKSQKPKGHAKIEVRDGKGKITLNVDGLNPIINDEKAYKGYLLSNDGLKLVAVNIGSIIVDSNGKGSVDWRFDPVAVGGTGIPIESFNVILVKLCSKNEHNDKTVVPLAGYIHDVDGSIPILISKLEKDIIQDSKTELKQYQNEQKKEKNYEELTPVEPSKTEDTEEVQKIQEVTQETEEIQVEEEAYEPEQEPEDNQVIDKIEDLDKEDVENKYFNNSFKQVEGSLEDNFASQNSKSELNPEIDINNPSVKYNFNGYNDTSYGHSINRSNTYIENARNYSKQIANYAMNILKFFDKVEPFEENLEGYKWWEIEYDSKNVYRGFLPFYNYLVNMYYPYPFMTKITTCQSLIKKYNHYIFGIVEGHNEIQYYVYGVPGRFTRDEQPFNGATGFTTWLKNKERSGETIGYWLIYIDALSGKIVTPLNPTIPPK